MEECTEVDVQSKLPWNERKEANLRAFEVAAEQVQRMRRIDCTMPDRYTLNGLRAAIGLGKNLMGEERGRCGCVSSLLSLRMRN